MTETRARTLLAMALALTATGIGMASTVSRDAGGVLVVAGWLALIAALHSFGRAGSSR